MPHHQRGVSALRSGLTALLFGFFVGCGSGADRSGTASNATQELSDAQRTRRGELIYQVVSDPREPFETSLLGKVTPKHKELFSLADESWEDGDEAVYDFVFRTHSDADPDRFAEGDAFLTLYVKGGEIIDVNYDVMVR